MVDRHQLPHESLNSPPSSMNEGDRRLLLLAAVSQSQREQMMMGMGTTQPKKEEQSSALVLKDSPCTSDVNAADAVSQNTAIRDASGDAPSQKQRDTSEATATINSAGGPTAVTSNDNGMPPLDVAKEEPPPPVTTQKLKRKVSECTRDAISCGDRLRALSETFMSAPTSLPAFSAPPLGRNVSGQGNNVVGGTLPMQMLGHDYHQQIMSMSIAGLSAPNMMLPMQAGPQPQQMQMMQHQQKTTEQKDGPLKKKRQRNKKDSNKRATTAQDVPKPKSATTKDGKPIVFPNQEIFSQILQMKTLKSPPQAAEALAAHIAPFYSRWKEDKASTSHWEPSLSVQKTMGGESYQEDPYQEDPLKIQSRFLEKEMALNRQHQEKQLQKYLSQQQQQQQSRRRRCTKDVSSEAQMSPMMCQQHQPIGNPHLSPLPPPSIPGQMVHLQVTQQDYLQRFLQQENRACFNPSNQQRIIELRHQAVMLEEQMRLREMDFIRERRRMVDQTVNRLRLQADILEEQLMM